MLVLVSFVILISGSILPNANYLAENLERQHPPLIQAAQSLDYILLLGSSGRNDTSLPITGRLSATALARFSEALRLYHANPSAKIVVSGSGFGDTQSHAQLMQALASAMSIPADKIIRLDNTKDTHQEAKLMSQIIAGKKAALVTSATHMPRAMKLFNQYNQNPIAAPTPYLAKKSNNALPLYHYIPSAYQLYKSELAVHEYLGRLQLWMVEIMGE